MERVLYNIHSQLCVSALQKTSSKTRRRLEHAVLLAGVCGFSVLFVSHVSFVYIDKMCDRYRMVVWNRYRISISKPMLFMCCCWTSRKKVTRPRSRMSRVCPTQHPSTTPFPKREAFYSYQLRHYRNTIYRHSLWVFPRRIHSVLGNHFCNASSSALWAPDTVVVNWLSVLGVRLIL
jgi:hypothetical protein